MTLELLETMRIPYVILDTDEDEALAQLHEIIVSAREKSIPHAIVIRKDTSVTINFRMNRSILVRFRVKMP